MTNSKYYHAHQIVGERCKGRLKCVRHCPTKALRIRDNKITFLQDLCIDCGNCINVCPEDAFVPVSDSLEDFKSFKYHVAMPCVVLYVQFGPDIHPLVINQALKNIGFDEIANVAKVCDEVGFALRHHLELHPEVRPLISSFCPATVRFIQVSYPNLVKYISPLDVPREIVARGLKYHYSKKLGIKIEEIGVTYITPCTAKIVSIKQPAEKERSWIDGAIPINDIYNRITPEIIKIQQEKTVNIKDNYDFGRAWGIVGHFSQNVGTEKALSVAGIDHVKLVLDDIENEKLHNIDFVEALACLHGCANGVFCVKDPYMARHNSILLQEKFGRPNPIDKQEVLENYNKGYYHSESPVLPRVTRVSPADIATSIKRMNKKERIYAKLPKKDCSLCGAPTCETFADDCARNEADITDCIFFSNKEAR
ncbi:MAG: 4Fe-4S dicluster domain-containing protein [Candidatus Aminicenantes bacterium]|nr:4Fe-4S dicluster domain-containing protein [Candidatus Aminicenantes bacterium]NIN19050.1 4Fe-4S dicluster domain-containing protein [Candidatus Aminicenantes bacterium]NIN42952.1 4Fe-4S dicluster domain-containing protein [Candidatus Aminicenantes bacterium]NIN85689.1 4Fe-4S dicluster domain-containing protein [Candidatus Aminicenantes bacterium]NIO81957.1 4Fe-4S dicluster domain-containing protein [Candidatus Aminicenantes bacterium]